MKCIVVLTLCFVVAVSGLSEELVTKMKAKVLDFAAVCIPESGATDADIAEMREKKTASRKEGKCLLSCFYKKFGIQGEDGLPSKEGYLALMEPARQDDPDFYTKFTSVAMKCGPKIREMGLTDHCEIASELSICVCAEAKAIGIEDPLKMRS